MAYKCLKCDGQNVEPLKVKRHQAEATFYKNSEGKYSEDNISFGTESRPVGIILVCKDCGNSAHPLEKDKFLLFDATEHS